MDDTSPEATRALVDAIRSRPADGRIREVLELSEDVRSIALEALRKRFPAESTLELVSRMTGEPTIPSWRAGPSNP